ncbi:hypothetical protein SBA2_590034 [Acidobacteriia bacterium SbA2]|nr:hypothetical protein SBA2_590034 [Acidobacteriia bacterium SbA2]
MGVAPEAVWALQLHVDEQSRRTPFLDAASPPHRQAVPGKLVINQSAGPEFKVGLPEELEAKLGRRDTVEVAGLAEKRENLL